MMLIIYLLLMLEDGGCKDYPLIETKTVDVGDHVKMTCGRRSAGEIFWMRIDSEYLPKILEETKNPYHHIKVRREPGNLELQITEARLNDSGFYLCLRKYQDNWTLMNLTSLTVKESTVATGPTSASSHLHESVTLSCLTLRDHQNKSCFEDANLLCFRADSIQILSSLNYTDNEEGGGFKCNREGCFCTNLKNDSLSDGHIYHCAVAEHGKNDFGGKSNPNTKATNIWSQRVKFFIGFNMAISLVVLAVLIYAIKESNGNASATLQTKRTVYKNQHDNVYTAVKFTVMKSCGGRKKANTGTKKIYATVRAFPQE